MSDNLMDKSGDIRDLLHGEISESESSDCGTILDFSSGSSDNYAPGEETYESDDSRCSPCRKVPRFDLSSQPGPSTSFTPAAASTPARHTGFENLSSEDEDDPVVSVPAPVPQTPAAPWVRVYDGEATVDPSLDFTVRNPGPRDCPINHSPIDYFSLFVTDGLLLLFVRETNIYAQKQIDKKRRDNTLTPRSRLSLWVNVTLVEMKKYISILFLMGICRRKSLAEYWSNDKFLHFPAIKSLMTMRRFEVLSSVLHLTSKPTLRKGSTGYDPWVKIRPFLDAVNDSFVRHYTPNQNLSLDESMVGMKNRCIFIQYMPNKRHSRYGIKKFELVDASTLYVDQILLYSGSDFLLDKPG